MANGQGGRRKGAGRKPGGGGSHPATRALRTEARALLAEIVGTERDPLMIAIEIAADKTKPDALRLEAALGAARYLHPTLSAVAVQHAGGKNADTEGLIHTLNERLARIAAPPTIDLTPMPDADPAPQIEGEVADQKAPA